MYTSNAKYFLQKELDRTGMNVRHQNENKKFIRIMIEIRLIQ
jgi:hypothetical protein